MCLRVSYKKKNIKNNNFFVSLKQLVGGADPDPCQNVMDQYQKYSKMPCSPVEKSWNIAFFQLKRELSELEGAGERLEKIRADCSKVRAVSFDILTFL
jgi:hypothetical protein